MVAAMNLHATSTLQSQTSYEVPRKGNCPFQKLFQKTAFLVPHRNLSLLWSFDLTRHTADNSVAD